MSHISRAESIDQNVPRSDPSSTFGSAKLRRDPVRVAIRLMDGAYVEGTIHVQPSTRTIDLLNQREEMFIAVTEARLTEPGGSSIELPFLAVGKANIARVYELTPSS